MGDALVLQNELKENVSFFLKKKILMSFDILNDPKLNKEGILDLIKKKKKEDQFLVLSSDTKKILENNGRIDINWRDLEKARALFEKKKNIKTCPALLQNIDSKKKDEKKVKVLFSYEEELKNKKKKEQDVVSYFNKRYNSLRKILQNRVELQNTISINRLLQKKNKEEVAVIGMVSDIETTKNNNLFIKVEDPTASIKIFINKNKPELFNQAKDITYDEVIGVKGVYNEKIIYTNSLFPPDIPLGKELKKCEEECYTVFLSDLHVGSTKFLPEQFNNFIKWINGEFGNEMQKEISKKVKYIFIAGDLIDGLGIYPGQESELNIKDIYKQYEECANLLKKIPSNISIIICPGNHDAMRLSEPQPPLYEDFAQPMFELTNVFLVSNPSLINIHSSGDFPGFDVLIYHGYSFDYYVANIDSIRNQGGYDRADLIMKFLLKKRHLAPAYSSTLYMLGKDKDPLVIERIPDFFVTGHIHKTSVSNYRNITLICGSCWQSKTPFQEKVGHHPEPCRVPVVNLKTRKVKILKF